MAGSCLIIVENLAVPFDRRTWQEAVALRQAGWQVSVICPTSKLHPLPEEEIEGIKVYRHPIPLEASGLFGFVAEYGNALFHETRLAWRVFRRHGFDVLHACNPPDLIFLVALPFKLLGRRFVYDQHDICPELYVVKFRRRGIGYWMTRSFEWLSYKLADLVITPNERYRQIGAERNGTPLDRIAVVRSVPDLSHFQAPVPDRSLRDGRSVLFGYVGIIGDQDGVENLVRGLAVLRDRHGFTDFSCRIVGDGPARAFVEQEAGRLGLQGQVTFTGYLRGQEFLRHVTSFDIGVIPDPPNPYTDNITMNKVFEYLMSGVPVVGFRLPETMHLVGDAGLFAADATPDSLGDAMMRLASDPALRARMSATARARATQSFDWDTEASSLVAAYGRLRPGRAGADVAV